MIEFTVDELNLGNIESELCNKLQLGDPQSSGIGIDEIKPGATLNDIMISGSNGSTKISRLQISNQNNNIYKIKVIK